jgi:hypothetical protein
MYIVLSVFTMEEFLANATDITHVQPLSKACTLQYWFYVRMLCL